MLKTPTTQGSFGTVACEPDLPSLVLGLVPLSAYEPVQGDDVLKRYNTRLTSLQQQILAVLGVPEAAYAAAETTTSA